VSFRVGITPDFLTHAAGLLEPALAEVLDPAPDVACEWMPDTAGVGVAEVLDRYDAVIALDYRFPAESFRGIRRLALLARWGVGYDKVDVPACTAADVILAITPDSVRRPMAEANIALIWALAKNLSVLERECRAGRWKDALPRNGTCLVGRTLGSVGLGNIATEMFRIAAGIGFGRLLAHSPRAAPEAAAALGVELTDLDTMLRESDFVTINCPLNPRTRGMIGARELALMKPSAYLINCARGAIVDERALVDSLTRRRIAGASLDVFETEPIPAGHPMLSLDNVIVTPHAAGRTDEAIRDTSLSACRAVLAVSQGEPPPYVANREALQRPGLLAKLRGFVRS
jgi:phosphoglycerate dehydrogenase-like enzyme